MRESHHPREQFVQHRREKRSPLLLFLLFLSEDHEFVQHGCEPGAALLFRYVQKDLPQKNCHLLRIVHCSVTGLSCSQINLYVITGIQQHDVLNPRFLEFLGAVYAGQFDIELLELKLFRGFLPLLYKIPGHDHGIPFAQKYIRCKFCSKDLIFRSLTDRFGVSIKDFLMNCGLREDFCRIRFNEISDQTKITSIGNRGSVLQGLNILLGD